MQYILKDEQTRQPTHPRPMRDISDVIDFCRNSTRRIKKLRKRSLKLWRYADCSGHTKLARRADAINHKVYNAKYMTEDEFNADTSTLDAIEERLVNKNVLPGA